MVTFSLDIRVFFSAYHCRVHEDSYNYFSGQIDHMKWHFVCHRFIAIPEISIKTMHSETA